MLINFVHTTNDANRYTKPPPQFSIAHNKIKNQINSGMFNTVQPFLGKFSSVCFDRVDTVYYCLPDCILGEMSLLLSSQNIVHRDELASCNS